LLEGEFYYDCDELHYCPNCGARMNGDKANNVRNLTDKETEIYDSWLNSEAKDTGENIMDGESNGYYVSRDDVRRFIAEAFSDGHFATNYAYAILSDKIGELPAADVKPVVHSKWTYGEDESGKDGIFCSNCEGFVPWDYEYYDSPDELISDNPICSHCGAKMIKDGEPNV
jgi:ribosomal protein S27AE